MKEDQDQGVCWGVVSEGFEGVMVECMMSYMLPSTPMHSLSRSS